MGSVPADYEEQLKAAAEKLKELLPADLEENARRVQKGLMLYRQSQVYNLRFDGGCISASVQDVTPVTVLLDLEFFQMSTCTCPAEGICRHQMAVFFTAYSKKSSVGIWLDEWKQPAKEKDAAAKWGIQRAKDLIKANGVLKPDYDGWVRSFEESFDSLLKTKNHVSPYVVSELFQIYSKRLKAAAPLEKEWKLLYDLIATVISLKKLAELSEEMGHTEDMVQRYYGHLFQSLLDEGELIIQKLGIQSLPFAFDAFIQRLKDDVFSLLTVTVTLEYERIYFYRMLWTKLFKNKKWREEEASKISSYLKETQGLEKTLPLLTGKIHLHVLLREDPLALDIIDSLEDEDIVPYMLYWIDLLSLQREWSRLSPYLELFIEKTKGYLSGRHSYYFCTDFTRMALKSIARYCTEQDSGDLYERALVSTLPYSYREYEYFLFDQKQFEKWGELNAFIGFQLQDVPTDRLKIIEKEQPHVLLSIYHQSVTGLVEMKNRQSYRVAARQLKKLRTLYKKLKRLDEWDFFFGRLLEKTKRLRAFHEECKRSKLIDA